MTQNTPKGLYKLFTEKVTDLLEKGYTLYDNNYSGSGMIMHAEFTNFKGKYITLAFTETYIDSFSDELYKNMDKLVELKTMEFKRSTEHFESWADNVDTETYYIKGGLLLTPNEALELSKRIEGIHKERINNRYIDYDKHDIKLGKLPIKGFKTGYNTLSVKTYKAWWTSGTTYHKVVNIVNSVTNKRLHSENGYNNIELVK